MRKLLLLTTLLWPIAGRAQYGQNGYVPGTPTAPSIQAAGPLLNVLSYNGAADEQNITAAFTISNGGTLLSAGSAPFTPSMVGKSIVLPGVVTALATFQGSIAGTILTPSGTVTGVPLQPNTMLSDGGVNIPTGVTITGYVPATGNYSISQSLTVASETMTMSQNALVSVISGYSNASTISLATAAGSALSAATETAWVGTDNAPAFNAQANACRATETSDSYFNCHMFCPPGPYLITESVNWTGINHEGAGYLGTGCEIYAATSGYPAFDMISSRFMHLYSLFINDSAYASPSVAIQMGRNNSNSSDFNHLQDVTVRGSENWFALWDMASENSEFDNVNLTNNSTGPISAGFVNDGSYLYPITSQFVTITLSPNTQMSNNQPSLRGVKAYGNPPYIINMPASFYGVSLYGDTLIGGTCVSLYFQSGAGALRDFHFDGHCESQGLVTNEFSIDGPLTAPVANNWWSHDLEFFGSQSYIKLGASATSFTMNNRDITVSLLGTNTTATLVDTPSAYITNGANSYAPSSSFWNLTNDIGCENIAGVIQCPNLPLSGASFPSTLNASQIVASGSVASISNGTGNQCFYIPGGGGPSNWQKVVFPSSPTGAVATGAITLMGVSCPGTGNNIASQSGSYTASFTGTLTGGTCSVAPKISVTVASGVVTGIGGSAVGTCTVLPTEPITVTGGTGGTLAVQNLGWEASSNGWTVTNGGSGYTSAPLGTLTATPTATKNGGCCANPTTTVVSSMLLSAGSNTEVSLTSTEAALGVAGTSGVPVGHLGAFHDTTCVTYTGLSSGGTITLAANQDCAILENTSALGTYSLKLPPITTINGQEVMIKSVGGITTENVLTSAAGSITGAPQTLGAQIPQFIISDGTTWH